MDRIDELLLELKRIMNVVDEKNYLKKISDILCSDSDYDKLFYHHASIKKCNLKTVKRECIDRIENAINRGSFNEKIRDYFMIKESRNCLYSDLYKIIDDNLTGINVDELQEKIMNNENVIHGIHAVYDISICEEVNYIKMYLASIFYEYMQSYISIVDNDDYYIDEDTRFIDIYNSLNEISDMEEVINVFDENIDEIIDIYFIYTNLDKKGRDSVHLKTISNKKENNLVKICPFSIMMLKNYYNLYYENEELKSVEIGNLTLRIIEDMIKDAYNDKYSFNDISRNVLRIIKSSYMTYNIDKWFDYLTANVYENIKNNVSIDNHEKIFIDVVKSEMNNVLKTDYFLRYVIEKFYEFNHDLYDERLLRELRSRTTKEDKILIKRINPFYDELEN